MPGNPDAAPLPSYFDGSTRSPARDKFFRSPRSGKSCGNGAKPDRRSGIIERHHHIASGRCNAPNQITASGPSREAVPDNMRQTAAQLRQETSR